MRKLKEDNYTVYIDALHALASNNRQQEVQDYTTARNKLLLIANTNVIKSLLEFEKYAVGKPSKEHDEFLTKLYISMREDLNIESKSLPTLSLRIPSPYLKK